MTELAPVAPNPSFITNRPAVERLAPARTAVQLSDNVKLEIEEKAINIIEAEMESELSESRKEQEHETKKKQSQKRKRTQTLGGLRSENPELFGNPEDSDENIYQNNKINN